MNIKLISGAIALLLCVASCTQKDDVYLTVIPQPNNATELTGTVALSDNICIMAPSGNDGADKVVRYLSGHFNVSDGEASTPILLKEDDDYGRRSLSARNHTIERSGNYCGSRR